MLTKTNYLSYSQCAKHFWLNKYQPEQGSPPSPSAQRRLRAGQEVDKLAREQFPDGVHIPYRPDPVDMALLTTEAITNGATTLFQATFAVSDLLVKVDILTQTPNGWHLIEVKSSTSYKANEHLPDVAFQLFVLQEAGINVTKASLMHLNSGCRYPNLSNLFTLADVTDDVFDFLPQVAEDTAVMRHLLTQITVPDVGIGRHCAKPYPCRFYDHCWQNVDDWTIYDIPYLKRGPEQQLEADGIRYVSDIPLGFALRDKRATAFVNRINQQQIMIDHETIQSELDALTYPLYFFDFETIDYAIPRFDNCKPYQQVPFQYSCHILHADGTLTHCDYLHTDGNDPRRPLTDALLK